LALKLAESKNVIKKFCWQKFNMGKKNTEFDAYFMSIPFKNCKTFM